MRPTISALACAALAAGLAVAAQPAAAQEVNFKDRQIRMIIGFGPGGGYDLYARTLARHLDRHLPGNPTIVAQNMPGAGSITAANTIFGNSPKDGTVIGIIARDTPIQPLTTPNTGAQFDATRFSWIGSPAAETNVCVATDRARVQTIDDLFKTELIIGGTGAGTGTEIYPKALNGLLGTRFRVIGGYPSSSDVALAMDRGEVHGICESYSSVYRRYGEGIKSGKIRILFQAGAKASPYVQAPFLLDKFEGEKRAALEFLYAGQTVGRPFVAPPDLQPGVLATLRRAFDATMTDQQFLADAEKQRLDIDPVSGAELEQLIKKVYATPKPILERVQAALK